MRQKPKPLRPKTGMNGTEQKYAELLEHMKLAGDILDYKFEAVKFRLAKATYYTPDFMVIFPNHIEFHEVKGFWRDDARVKIKVASGMFPEFGFMAVQLKKKQWEYEEFECGN